jgi:hypothetical protein
MILLEIQHNAKCFPYVYELAFGKVKSIWWTKDEHLLFRGGFVVTVWF